MSPLRWRADADPHDLDLPRGAWWAVFPIAAALVLLLLIGDV